MTAQAPELNPDRTLADLAVSIAGASRVFHRHGLDFCCHGHVALAEACAGNDLDPATLIAEIEGEARGEEDFEDWGESPLPSLVDHILARFHEGHRADVPALIEMARKVERVHADKATCPRGLTEHLEHMATELELHMQKEEQVLFPLLKAGQGRAAAVPIQVMETEHRDHAKNLEILRGLTGNYEAPAEACGTWGALYLRLHELEGEVMQHMHLENNVLFPRALRS